MITLVLFAQWQTKRYPGSEVAGRAPPYWSFEIIDLSAPGEIRPAETSAIETTIWRVLLGATLLHETWSWHAGAPPFTPTPQSQLPLG
jgi:hypothetical protein